MGDWDQQNPQLLALQKTASQFRSQSLPRLLGNAASLDASDVKLVQTLNGNRERFQRTAHTVGDCLQAVKGLSQQANSARSFREKCSNLSGAAIAASLALQEALSSDKGAAGDLSIQAIATDVQKQLLSADALVRKYGHERIWDSLVRFESKADVDSKFDSVIQALQALTNRTWDFIDPENRIKRDVMEQGVASSFITTGEAFSRHSLRPASKHKVQALATFPDEEGEGPDGVVAWAAHGNIKCLQLSSQITTDLLDAGRNLTCMAYDRAGYIWSGHADGSVQLWSIQGANAAGSPARVADSMITAIAVDADTGFCWAGTEDGEVFVLRLRKLHGSIIGRLEIARQLLGYDAHSPAALSQQTDSSNASISEPIAASSAASSHWSSRHSSCHKAAYQHHLRSKPKPHFARPGAGRDLLENCLPSQTPRSGRMKDSCVHAGPVNAILICAGRAYTAGGSGLMSASILVWDSASFELLRTISKRSTRWCRSPATCLTMVHWNTARQRLGSGTLSSSGSSSLGISSNSSIGPASGPTGGRVDKHLITGHADGSVLMWDPTGDTLKPILMIGQEKGPSKKAVKSVAVLDELGLLACGHANGKVYLRKLDPKCRKEPRGDGVSISRWNPTAFTLQVHRLGLVHMAAGGHLLVTSGKTGSVKLWPETMLRCLAHEAGIQLPHSHNPVSEAVNSLLARAGLTAYGSGSGHVQIVSQRPQQLMSPTEGPQQLSQRYTGEAAATAAGVSKRSEQQQGQRPSPELDAAEAAAAIAATENHSPLNQQGQQQQQLRQQEEQQTTAGREAGRELLRSSSTTGWSRDMRAASWCLEFDALGLDSNRRRVIGSGSYGRVEIGSFNQTDVAVKILTDLPKEQEGLAECPSWDEARLRALRQEVSILSTLRHPNVVLFMGVCLSPPAIVTEYCPLRSLYDVLKKARIDQAMACRLTWTRRLLMALDAARGMLYLHSHSPIILHRDLKSPNLFVTNALHVKVGDFNLSRYMTLGASFVKSSLEINPRWNAPEVISEGYYSPAADVYAFGVVLWELLTWQEPWEEEGLHSFQIMVAVQQQQQRPSIPPLDQLPGQLGPTDAVQGYLDLMSDCWAQNYMQRPSFQTIVTRLKSLLKMGGPNAAPGPSPSPAAAAAAPSPFHRNASEGALLAAGAAAQAAHAEKATLHKHTQSEDLTQTVMSMKGPDIADLLQIGDGSDDLPGPSAPAPPAAALPPIPATTPDGYGSDAYENSNHSSGSGAAALANGGGVISRDPSSSSFVGYHPVSPSSSTPVSRQISLAAGVAEAPIAVVGGGTAEYLLANSATAAAKPPKPPRSPAAYGNRFQAPAAATGSPFSPFAAASQQQPESGTNCDVLPARLLTKGNQQQQQQGQQMPVSYHAGTAALGFGRPAAPLASPFAAASSQAVEPPSVTAAAVPLKAINVPVAVPAALGQVVEQGGSPFSRSPIKASPFAAAALGAAADVRYSEPGHGSGLGGVTRDLSSGMQSSPAVICPLEAAVEAGSAVDAVTRARHSSSGASKGASSSPKQGSAQGQSGAGSGGSTAQANGSAATADIDCQTSVSTVVNSRGDVALLDASSAGLTAAVASLGGWTGADSGSCMPHQASAPATAGQAAAVSNLISLDSETLDSAATAPVTGQLRLSAQNPFAAAAANGS